VQTLLTYSTGDLVGELHDMDLRRRGHLRNLQGYILTPEAETSVFITLTCSRRINNVLRANTLPTSVDFLVL
jgi:hypothetical protein